MPDDRLAGSALVTRRAVADIVRSVTLGSYGVAEVGGTAITDRLARWLGRPSGVGVSLANGSLSIELRLRVAHGLPIAEVARQVDSAVRFAIRQALGREIDTLSIRVDGLEVRPGAEPPRPATTASEASSTAPSGSGAPGSKASASKAQGSKAPPAGRSRSRG